jgi:hypothetical protein
MKWATERQYWSFQDWRRMCWSDENTFTLNWSVIYVTRKSTEGMEEDCMVPSFRGYKEWTVWACITDDVKGPLVFVEKD